MPSPRTAAGRARRRRAGGGRRAAPSARCRARAAAERPSLLQPEGIERAGARGDEHALRLEVRVERLEAQLAAEAGLLVAAERDAREGRVRRVDGDLAGLDPAGQAQRLAAVAR